MTTNLTELKELVEFMRANGVVQCGEVVLDPNFHDNTAPIDKHAKVKKVLVKEGILGADGLTADEQLEIHMRVIDAVAPVYREED